MISQSALSLAVLVSSLATTTYDYTVLNTPQAPQPRITQEMRDMSTTEIKELIKEVWNEDSYKGIMVASCESQLQQFDKDGTVLRGRVNPDDIGIFQINSFYHEEDYLKMNIDVFTPIGNIMYAKFIYDRSGLAPWVHSKHCWSKLLTSS